eukprot:2020873-Prymnesium_polylepis.1
MRAARVAVGVAACSLVVFRLSSCSSRRCATGDEPSLERRYERSVSSFAWSPAPSASSSAASWSAAGGQDRPHSTGCECKDRSCASCERPQFESRRGYRGAREVRGGAGLQRHSRARGHTSTRGRSSARRRLTDSSSSRARSALYEPGLTRFFHTNPSADTSLRALGCWRARERSVGGGKAASGTHGQRRA